MNPYAIALCVVVPLLAYFVARWLYTKDTEIEQRRLKAAKVAAKLQAYGLKHVPNLLLAYSVGDYSGFANELANFVRMFEDGEEAILKELDATFARVLEAKLSTPEGRSYIDSALAAVDSEVM